MVPPGEGPGGYGGAGQPPVIGGSAGSSPRTSTVDSRPVDGQASRIEQEFTALPLRELADAALAQARSLGAQHADFRAERIRGQQIGLSDGTPQTLFDADNTGLAVRVIVDGTWGFASTV